MKNNYETVIGIEVHVELNTRTKMFCRCSAEYFGAKPNTHTCPVCLGLPGATPLINEEVIKKCIQIGLALNCSINEESSYFERKNYFYPDLAKGYQISQLVKPLCINGWLMVTGDDGKEVKIRINRAHQEEDTGKLTHTGGETLIDYNRSSVPLTEIVTEPDFRDSSQVKDYAKKLQEIFRTLKVSNADMERGDMRLEANVSVRPVGQKELPPYRVELKNINSFRFMVAAIEYEVKRQTEALERGEKLSQETRGWNEDKKETYLQRSKEEAHDYRYFPEPDLPLLKVGKEYKSQVQEDVVRLMKSHPEVQKQILTAIPGISVGSATTIAYSPFKSALYAGTAPLAEQQNIPLGQVGSVIANTNFGTEDISLVKNYSHEVLEKISAKSSGVISDEGELEKICQEVIEENQKSVEDYKSGKLPAIQALIGGVMRKTQGKADVGKVKEILEKLLAA